MKKIIRLPLPKVDAELIIREIVANDTGKVAILDHARMRMLERDVTDKQVMLCISEGDLVKGPEFDREKEIGWKCTFTRRCAGMALRVGCKLVQRDEAAVLVLTAFRRE